MAIVLSSAFPETMLSQMQPSRPDPSITIATGGYLPSMITGNTGQVEEGGSALPPNDTVTASLSHFYVFMQLINMHAN